MSDLAILGGGKAVASVVPDEMFRWPIINDAIRRSVAEVIEDGNMSGTNVTKKFERGFADWHSMKYGLGHCNGTAALHAALFGLGVGRGDEVITPSITYWASGMQAMSLGASIVFADIDPQTLCVDPDDIERRITERTKVIVVVHYLAYPADMDRIMAIARGHRLKVLEDVSHAHGGKYKGRMLGTIGDASGFSLMSGKSFAIGEGGIMLTNDREVYERAIIFGHHCRHGDIEDERLRRLAGIPHGGYKYRMHQVSSAMGLEQLRKYPEEMAEIDKAMNYFWDLLRDVPGLDSHRPRNPGSSKGGWYAAHGIYKKEELGGLSVQRFCEAVRAEGVACCHPGCNRALHTHPLFTTVDVYRAGSPTNQPRLRSSGLALPVSESVQERVFNLPWFKKWIPGVIEEYAEAHRKVAVNYKELLPGDTRQDGAAGTWALTVRK